LGQSESGSLSFSATGTDHLYFLNSNFAFDPDMEGAFVYFSPVYDSGGGTDDQGRYLWEVRQVLSVFTDSHTNDSLSFSPDLSFTPVAGATKVWIDYQKTVNRNGVIVSNGRKFWLLQAGAYSQVMDLGSDDYLGLRWKGSQIASDRILLTCDKRPPRLFYFREDVPNTATADETSYAGLGTPIKPPHKEPIYTEPPVAGNVPTFAVQANGAASGALSAGDYRVMVRAVNLTDGTHSKLVRAWNSGDPTTDVVTCVDTDALLVFTSTNNSAFGPPPFDQKWTHFEIWRTEADGAEYFLEGRIPIVSYTNEWRNNLVVSGNSGPAALMSSTTAYYELTCEISDADLNRRTQLTTTDLLAGYRPPVCQEVASVQGVTVCAGKAHADANPFLTQNAYMMYAVRASGGAAYTVANKYITYTGLFASYTDWTEGDTFVFTSSTPSEEYTVKQKVSNDVIELDDGPIADIGNVTGYIRRAYSIESEKIASDEDVWYSRTDQYAPESFQLRTLTLSRTGDVFRGIRAVGRYAAVVMADGVHLLYLTTDLLGAIVLEKHTVASSGAGTPWADSIVTWERNVAWATSRGPVVMRVSDEADDLGARAKLGMLDESGGMRDWFADAYRLGETIDAGVDTKNECIRFRRQKSGGVNEVLQFSYRTGLWTTLKDTGRFYARSWYADSAQSTEPLLYSVLTDGTAREVNYEGLTHPYDTKTVQATTDGTYTVTTTRITKNGLFSTAMQGELIYFRKAGASYDGTWRVITAATANYVEFAAVTNLAAGAEFIIAPCQFKWRTPPIVGGGDENHKVLSGLIVRARPGTRAVDGNWGTPSGLPLSVRTFRDFYDGEEVDEQLLEIPVYEESDDAKTSQSPVSTCECAGTAIEVEVECLEARTDFLIQSIKAHVRETVSVADASTTE